MADNPTGAQRGDNGTLFETDHYLNDIAAGRVSDGDQLGELLSTAAFQAGCQMPEPPVLADYGIGYDHDMDTMTTAGAVSAGAVSAGAVSAAQPAPMEHDELSARRAQPRRKEASGWLYALAGAAASAAVVAGGLTVVHSAQPGDALWTTHEKIFGSDDEAQLVELASTLEQATELKKQGDMDGALRLLDQAQRIAATRAGKTTQSTVTTVRSLTKTVTETSVKTEKPETVTVTSTPVRTPSTPTDAPVEPTAPAPPPTTTTVQPPATDTPDTPTDVPTPPLDEGEPPQGPDTPEALPGTPTGEEPPAPGNDNNPASSGL